MHNSMHIGTKNQFRQTAITSMTKNPDKFIDQQIKGVMGSTWDAKHLTSFLNRSFYSNKKSPQKDQQYEKSQKIDRKYNSTIKRKNQNGDYFFKNLRYDMNTSHIGFTKVNPLVSNVQVSKQRQQALIDFFKTKTQKFQKSSFYSTNNEQKKSPRLRCDQNSKFKYQSNTIKFKATDPLTNQYQTQKNEKIGFSIQRMKRQINVRYQHGMIGIDHPTNNSPIFYQHMDLKSPKIRQVPISEQSFLLSRQWKTKKRASLPQTQLQPLQQNIKRKQCIRKLRNQNVHGYDIVNNRIVD